MDPRDLRCVHDAEHPSMSTCTFNLMVVFEPEKNMGEDLSDIDD